MTYETLIAMTSQAMILTLLLSLPVVATAALLGFGLAIFQALTQLQDQTMPMAIKIVACFVVVILSGDWMAGEMMRYTEQIFIRLTQI
jgi:type III secretion protein S